MARIPTQSRMNPSSTPVTGPMRGGVTDLGLGSVAQSLAQLAERRQQQADERATAAYSELETGFTETFKPAAEAYDGSQPGFARDQIAAYDARAAEISAGLDPDARRAFERINLRGRVRTFDAAMGVEATASGQRIKEARKRAQELRLVQGMSAFTAEWSEAKAEGLRNYTGEAEGFAQGLLVDFDGRAKAAIEAAADEDRPLIELMLANVRANELMKLQAFEATTRAAWETETVRGVLETVTASVTSNEGGYQDGLAQVRAAVEALGGERAVRLKPKVEQQVTVAWMNGILARGDHGRVVEMLESGEYDQILGDAKPQLYATATARVNSEADQLAAVTLNSRLEAEIASVATTGVSTGFDPAEMNAISPAAAAQARIQLDRARQVYTATQGLEGLTPADQVRRVDALKPKPGDPGFAVKQAVYELALQQLDAARARQLSDPATAIQSDPGSANLWRQVQAEPTNRALRGAWAGDALSRQARLGIPASQQRILPRAEARRVAEIYTRLDKGDAPGRTEALMALHAYVDSYGGYAGRVLRELQTSGGLSASDAAALALSEGDPVLLGRYTRAIARQASGRVDAQDDKRVRERLERLMQPYRATFAGQDGGVFSDQVFKIAWTMARAELLDGASVEEAARAAYGAVSDRYLIANGIRIPRTVLGGTVRVPEPSRLFAGGAAERSQEVLVGDLPGGRRGELPAQLAIMEGARRTAGDLLIEPASEANRGQDRVTGPGLQPSGTARGGLSEAQVRRAHADHVADRGRWITLPDDSGLMLVIPDARGGVAPVKGADGRPITRTWAQLRARAEKP